MPFAATGPGQTRKGGTRAAQCTPLERFGPLAAGISSTMRALQGRARAGRIASVETINKAGPLDPARERDIIAAVRDTGNMTDAGRDFGLSRQRIWQIVHAYELRTGETVRPVRVPAPPPKPKRAASPADGATPDSRKCTKCEATARTPEQVAEMFYPRRKGGKLVGYREACKVCSKAAATEYLRAHPERQDKWRSYYAKRGLVKGAKQEAKP